jgi:hypothetical protein
MLKVVSAKLSSAPGGTGWAQAHEFEPQDTDKIKSRAKLFVAISTSTLESGIDVIATGRELLARLNEEYYGKLDTNPFYALKSAIQKVSTEFKNTWGNVEIGAVVVMGDVMYASAVGGAGVLISRGGNIATILQSKSETVMAASGYPKNDDVILLASKNFFSLVPFGVIKAGLSAASPEEAVETFTPIVRGSEVAGGVCAEVLQFKKIEPVNLEKKEGDLTTEERVFVPLPKKDPKAAIKTFLSRLKVKLPNPSIYIKPVPVEEISPQSKKTTFLIALILLVLLAVSIVFGVRQKQANDFRDKYKGIMEQSLSEVDQAISLASVSPERSRELFASAQDKLKQIENMNIKDPELENLRKKIQDGKSSILGEFNLAPQMFLDLTLLTSGFKGTSLALTGGRIYVMDHAAGRIISVDIATKKSEVVAGPGVITAPSALAGYESRVFVLQADGVYEVDKAASKIINKTWTGEALISAFGGNIYLMDKAGGLIYRYQGKGSLFGEKQNWLATGVTADFNEVKQIGIDGSVYVLYPNTKILKYSQGSPQSFSPRGVVPQIGNADAISAGPDNEYVYLLDKAGSRVVVLDKKGVYKAQYVDPQIVNAVQFTVSEPDKKIILLTGEKLFSIEINH